jgi:hypothetical protein
MGLGTWFVKPLIKGPAPPEGEDYYSQLGTNKGADVAAIKAAYKARSLELHPDKIRQRGREVTEADTAHFQHIKEMYEVLNDPEKRKVYDELGPTGVRMLEDPANPENLVDISKNFLSMRNRDRLKLILLLLIIVGILLLFPILVCAKVDDEISAGWVVVWIPLWIINVLVLWAHFMMLAMADKVCASLRLLLGYSELLYF